MNAVKRNKQGGFTLIELAIVLVIIGLILGAILKGQDLITNARAKKFANWINQWQVQQMVHLDRKGRYAGDSEEVGTHKGNGVIGDSSTDSDAPFSNEITTTKGFTDVPDTSINLGNFAYYMYMGHDTRNSVTGKKVNVIVVTNTSGSSAALDKAELPFFEMFDNNIDNVTNAGAGRVRAITVQPTFIGTGLRVVSGVTELSTTTPFEWAASYHGLVYYFDSSLE